jgi:dUTP pyrophosphatase
MATKGMDVLAGVIDSDYRGEIICILINHSKDAALIKEGDRIAQLIVERIALLEPVWVAELTGTDRGDKGFGSSG